jgi:Uma2 family endonuclease
MVLPVKSRPMTPEEYLRIEREAPFKSEYYGGEMFAMAGGGRRHSLIKLNVGGTLRALLKGHRCTAYDSDLRVGIPGEGLYTYPDVTVFCEPMAFMPGTDDTATNPAIIVEVLSKTTEAYDRGRKFEAYRQLPSLREYLLVSQDAPLIERFTREGDDRWVLTTVRGLDAVVPLEIIEAELPLAEVYDKVDFSTPETPPAAGAAA